MNDNLVVVPNSQLVDTILTNLRGPDGALSVEVDLNVATGSDLQTIESVTLEAAEEAMKSANGADSKLAPSLYFQTATGAAYGVAVLLRVTESAHIEKVRHEFVKRLTESYRTKEIKLA